MTVSWRRRFGRCGQPWAILTVLMIGLLTLGCTSTGPQWAWRNPFQADSSAVRTADTLAARIDEAHIAAEQAADLSAAEQLQVSTRLVQTLDKESHPAVRTAIVQALGEYRTPAAMEGLRLALQDADRDVRIAACGSLARWGLPESFGILAETVRSDTDVDVRLAATRLLGESDDPAAMEALRSALEDSDPAVQYVAMQSLKRSTGQDLGNDLGEWKRIAREMAPSMRQAVRDAPEESSSGSPAWR